MKFFIMNYTPGARSIARPVDQQTLNIVPRMSHTGGVGQETFPTYANVHEASQQHCVLLNEPKLIHC